MSNAWMPFYFADYLADTGHLTLAGHGAYLLLMAHYYQTRKPLPANAALLHRICRCVTRQDKRVVASVLCQFFTKTLPENSQTSGHVYHHARIDKEIEKANGISEKRSKAAYSRYANAPAIAPEMHTQSQSQLQKPKSTPLESDLSETVFEVAKIHPRIAHRIKGPSRIEQEVIAQAISQDGRDLVLAGTRNLADMVAHWPVEDRRFVPDPVKFYQREDYKLDPSTWDRRSKSKTEWEEFIRKSEVKDALKANA